MNKDHCHDVVIVGSGPAGIAAATELRHLGVRDVLLLEREGSLGGVPRHCGHRAFGLAEFGRLLRGPDYACRLAHTVADVRVMCDTSVISLHPAGVLTVNSKAGTQQIKGRCVLLATGTRETPRSARMVSGTRPWGVMTTGALQQFVYLKRLSPCRRAVIVGSELVAYSALLTLRHAGARAVAMIETGPRAIAFPRLGALAPAVFGTRLITEAELIAIHGDPCITGVEIERNGQRDIIYCDAVIFTGEFVPESALVRASHLDVDTGTGGPVVDQYGRCSDPAYFAAGNLLRPVEPAWRAWYEGRAVAKAIAGVIRGELSTPHQHSLIFASPPLQFVCPQRHAAGGEMLAAIGLHVRTTRQVRGRLQVFADGHEICSRQVSVGPLRRIDIPVDPEAVSAACLDIRISED